MPPTLYIVATPIGNLEDITLRALRILKDVETIAAEDTRHTAVLLRRYDIRTPTTSFHEHNEREKIPFVLAKLARGESVAVVSDSGTPGISDPGYRLVKAAIEAGYRVEAVPGPCAILTALVSSGFPTDTFTFLGFPPRKPQARREWASRLAAEPRTVIFFEAPHRLRQTLSTLAAYLVDRPICVAKELTKVHEQSVIKPIHAHLADVRSVKGEYVIVVPPGDGQNEEVERPSDEDVASFIGHSTNTAASRRELIRQAAQHFKVPARAVYAALERTKKAHSRSEP